LPAFKRIKVTLSEFLLSKVDSFTVMDKRSHSDIVREALQCYLDKSKRELLVEQMKNGYVEMALINLTLACEIFDLEENQDSYENRPAEWQHI
jgi:CopG family transcriptional regulator/antitoxin EndoAI